MPTTAVTLLHGSCLDLLPTLDSASVDSIVTDPPYELGFMGKQWDASGIAYNVMLWAECLRVLKPGGHLLAFGGTRTYHRMACAIEDAGFEIRDSIHWLYGSGFPKSLDVSKAIDKAAGIWRGRAGNPLTANTAMSGQNYERTPKSEPATDAARQWEGWGTALKPAHEPIVVARKPLAGTVAANVLKHGTGALNIDGCRVGDGGHLAWSAPRNMGYHGGHDGDGVVALESNVGRWPANVVIDEAIADAHPEWGRFFYCPKPDRGERDMGLGALPTVTVSKYAADAWTAENMTFRSQGRNFHPTVKPVDLMRWLVRLVTPPNGTVLDPFAGSGTTLVAARLEGFAAIGIEMTAEYLPIIEGRLQWAQEQAVQLSLFGEGGTAA